MLSLVIGAIFIVSAAVLLVLYAGAATEGQ